MIARPPAHEAPTGRAGATERAIQARRGCYLRVGDVVKLHPQDRRRVLSIAEVTGTVFVAGEWEVLTGSMPRPEVFRVPFLRWFTIEAPARPA